METAAASFEFFFTLVPKILRNTLLSKAISFSKAGQETRKKRGENLAPVSNNGIAEKKVVAVARLCTTKKKSQSGRPLPMIRSQCSVWRTAD